MPTDDAQRVIVQITLEAAAKRLCDACDVNDAWPCARPATCWKRAAVLGLPFDKEDITDNLSITGGHK